MAHESKGAPPSVADLGKMARQAHENQHGLMKANENLPGLPQESGRVLRERAAREAAEAEEAEALDDEEPKAKAQRPAEDKAQAGPRAEKAKE